MISHTIPCLLLATALVASAAPKPGAHDPADAVKNLEVHGALRATLFASEPMILSPSSIDVDHLGRVWVCEVVNYRRNKGKRPEGDRIVILEDTNGDNVADKGTVFYQGNDIDSAHGICVLGDRVIVSAGNDVFYLIDENGDGKSDRKELLFTNVGGAQHDHGIHAFHFGPDGKLYFNFGNAARQLCDKDGKIIVDLAGNEVKGARQPYQQGMIFRCDLDGSNVETLAWNFRNNWEVCIDSFGRLWQSDNDDDGNRGVRINYVLPFGNYGYRDELTGAGWRDARVGMHKEIPYRHFHQNDPGVVPNLLQTGAGSPTGICVYEGSLLPREFYGQPIHCDAGPNIVRAYPVTRNGAGFDAESLDILNGKANRWFRPSDVCVAPDGSLVVADWYDPGVGGHGMGDIERGRIFLVAPGGHKYSAPPIDLSNDGGILKALASPNEATRYLAYTALRKMDRMVRQRVLQTRDADPAHLRGRAFWALVSLAPKPQSILEKTLGDKDPLLRAAAVRAFRVVDPKGNHDAFLARSAKDPDPAVRAETAIALRFSDRSSADEAWATIAKTYQGDDRWFVEALGIGAELNWSSRFAAYLKATGNKPHPDLVWRARCEEALPFLGKLIIAADEAKDRDRYVRSLHFHPKSDARQEFALALFKEGSPEVAVLALQELDRSAIDKAGGVKRLEELALQGKDSPALVELATRFNLQSDAVLAALLKFIVAHRNDSDGANAARHLLGNPKILERTLGSGDLESRRALATALGRSGDKRALNHLQQTLERAKDTVVRRACVEALAITKQGEQRLLTLAKNGKLADDVKFATGALFSRSSNEATRKEIAKVLNLPAAPGTESLPPLSQLMALKGQPKRGVAAFTKASCATCHQVNGVGLNFGPDLSEIGNKLPKEGLFEAILYPSNAVAHGYTGVEVGTKSGDTVVGFISSETAERITIRMAGGITRDLKPSEIKSRKELDLSLMPAGLAGLLHPLELADLVAYLESLKK
jgi:putative membrane-bound dehydrogenase-like protein